MVNSVFVLVAVLFSAARSPVFVRHFLRLHHTTFYQGMRSYRMYVCLQGVAKIVS